MTFQQRSQWNYYPEASCPEGTSCTRTWLQQSFCWVSANLAVIWWWENMGNVVFPRSLRFSWQSQNLWIDLPQKTFWTYCHQWDFFEHQGEWFIFFQMLAWCFAASDLNAKCQSHLDDTDPRWTARSNHSIHRQTKDFTATMHQILWSFTICCCCLLEFQGIPDGTVNPSHGRSAGEENRAKSPWLLLPMDFRIPTSSGSDLPSKSNCRCWYSILSNDVPKAWIQAYWIWWYLILHIFSVKSLCHMPGGCRWKNI